MVRSTLHDGRHVAAQDGGHDEHGQGHREEEREVGKGEHVQISSAPQQRPQEVREDEDRGEGGHDLEEVHRRTSSARTDEPEEGQEGDPQDGQRSRGRSSGVRRSLWVQRARRRPIVCSSVSSGKGLGR